MKRNGFLQFLLTVGAMSAAPFRSLAAAKERKRVTEGFKVDSTADRFGSPIKLFEGDTFTTKISTKDTEGDIYVFESSRMKEGGPSLHTHFEQDEWWYVLKGTFMIKVGEKTYEAKAGDSVFGPRMVPHSFSKVGEEEGKLLMIFQPAGKMEEFFTKISQGIAKNMTEAEQDKLREEHGFKRVGPPLGTFKKW
ncbi:cupin domain-containing protein [Dyadobacter sp. CY326]|uniref:cupin domain-containing protein n=1 Tax=Dyadobacter sp. CY326 TaxID=2907300 RepID=UPI001F36BD7A|nr:cupin domain-containing protein [Dyadobacter sp. CY326]MCE7064590.1 cupin domain-containing protein [Dyadobacter sp. CY326]